MLDEQIKYAEYAKDNFPVDCVAAAIYWNRNVVDGKNIDAKIAGPCSNSQGSV